MHLDTTKEPYVTVNPCRLCMPLGASLALKGIRNCMPLIHGSQGCATYIRRFLISHFREPVDIASSSFSEETAIFGGDKNLIDALTNVTLQYHPEIIGIATSCLTEIIGDDIDKIIHKIRSELNCRLVAISTPSFKGSHCTGFHETVTALVKSMCTASSKVSSVTIAPPILSPSDLRYIRNLCTDFFDLHPVILPDYSESLDGGTWDVFTPVPEGGTPVTDISKAASESSTFIELGNRRENSAGSYLKTTFNTNHLLIDTPIGIEATDRFLDAIADIAGMEIPAELLKLRRRCIDNYIDAHKYVSGITAVVYGDEDMVPSIAAYCLEIGLKPVICASEGRIRAELERRVGLENISSMNIYEDTDFNTIETSVAEIRPDLMLGTGKGTHISIKYDIPLVRIGFPVHDRFGANRQLHAGYDGAMAMLDNIVNILLSRRQEDIPDGYSYL